VAAAGGGGGALAVESGGKGIGELQCAVGKLAVGSIGAKEGQVGVLHGEQRRRRPWHTVASLACGQGLGLALGEAEQVWGEARQPGTQRIIAGRWRMAGEVLPTVTQGGGRVTDGEGRGFGRNWMAVRDG
jgi:hypothetical protein